MQDNEDQKYRKNKQFKKNYDAKAAEGTVILDPEAACSFCGAKRKNGHDIMKGPDGVAICKTCAKNVCEMFGVNTSNAPQKRNTKRSPKEDLASRIENLSPRKIKEALDRCVVGQEETKKALSVAVYNHYKRIAGNQNPSANEDPDLKDVKIEKSNIILAGPTGCGKTLLAKTLAELLDVPFAIADATTLTEAGYVGEDVENIVRYLWINADHDVKRAGMGICVTDEIDKIASKTQNVSITRDVSGEGVQQALLKIVEGTTCRFPPDGGRKHPESPLVEVDTKDILFIAAGAFVGMDKIIERRQGHSVIGFSSDTGEDADDERKKSQDIQPEDLVAYGLIPELVGRFPIVSKMRELTEDELVHVLTEPTNAITKQYRKLLAQSGVRLKFDDDVLRQIAQKAIKRKTGARGLRAEIERIMLDVMYELPDKCQKGDTVEVTTGGVKIVHTGSQNSAFPATAA